MFLFGVLAVARESFFLFSLLEFLIKYQVLPILDNEVDNTYAELQISACYCSRKYFYFFTGNSDWAEISIVVTNFHPMYVKNWKKFLTHLSGLKNYVFQQLFFWTDSVL